MLQKLFKRDENSKGFTLIEVVIVLAIAGLIFVIVFLAVSAAQRARRDNARQQAASRYLAAAEQFAGNNNGVYPTATSAGWPLQYFNNQGNPNGGTWTFVVTNTPAANQLSFNTTACGGTAATPRVGAARVQLEAGAVYCVDNE